jgi:serine/threonine-protein kinase
MLKKILTYLLIGVITIVGVALVLNVVMMYVVGGHQVTVPDVRGLREPQALSILEESGLRLENEGDEFSIEYPESTVSLQHPLPGHVVKQGRKILVRISRGAEFRDVPYCLGKPLRTATIILERAGFVVDNVTRVASTKGYPDEVLSTEPLPGSEALRGSLVNVLVNDGLPQARVILPDLRDEPYLVVKMKLERLGLLVRESSMDEEFKPLRSRVVMHEPPAGFIVSQGDTVNLITTARKRERQSL